MDFLSKSSKKLSNQILDLINIWYYNIWYDLGLGWGLELGLGLGLGFGLVYRFII